MRDRFDSAGDLSSSMLARGSSFTYEYVYMNRRIIVRKLAGLSVNTDKRDVVVVGVVVEVKGEPMPTNRSCVRIRAVRFKWWCFIATRTLHQV